MTADLSRVMEEMGARRVLVVGEAILDSYLEGCAGRLCREAPVPIVDLSRRKDVPGGAANTAANVRALGGTVRFLSVTGDDDEGRLLRRALEVRGVPIGDLLVEPNRGTLAKNRVVADGQILIRYDQGGTYPIGPETEARVILRLGEAFTWADAVIVSDYSYGVLTDGVVATLERLLSADPTVLVVDAKDPRRYRGVGVTAAKPNFPEVLTMLGAASAPSADRVGLVAAQSERLLDLTGARVAAVTLDSEGALILERGSEPYRTYARPRPNSRATGAGDTFTAALGLALAAGADPQVAGEVASAAAAVVVGKDGTAACSAEELHQYLSDSTVVVPDAAHLSGRLEFYREQGYSIVFTNGCFDILHRGHIAYLNRAKSLGDVLVVGLNSDASVRRLKGPDRPINSLEDRAQVLGALSCIDHIVPFEEDTPAALIEAIRPDVYVKGGDYTRATLPEAPLVERLGGRVELLPYVEAHSTTGIIRQIRGAGGRGPGSLSGVGPEGR